ncbi:Bax inhibitor-1/YccA family protein [Lysinibacillus sp. 54212]|uniref:Bax inhibitor-1/YccA family protein n=1 Tax=Lysinibacillus sp. 54212 TaxID=3119829 RepID=UPI002FCC3110
MHSDILGKVLKHFTFMWVLTGIGLFTGSLLSPAIILPISIITIILLIVSIFVRSIRLANIISYALPFLIGITLFWTTQFYIEELGAGLVFSVLIGTIAVFILLGVVGMMIRDISSIGMYLFATLIVVFIFSIIFFFIPVSNTIMLVFAAITVLLFVIYTVYDFNQIRHGHVQEHEAVRMALNLYLDFINIFVNVLEVIWRLKD